MHLDKVIFRLKKEHKDIFHVQINEQDFIFRPLTKQEYDNFVLNERMYQDYIAEKVCDLCTLYPEDYDFYDPRYAGAPESLYEAIIDHSGFASQKFVENLLLEYREANQEDRHRQLENTIIGTFENVTLDDIDNMNVYEVLDYYSRAEWIIENLKRDLVHPEKVRQYKEELEEEQANNQQDQYTIQNKNAQNNKKNLKTNDMPDHWDVDPEKLQQQNNDDAPGMKKIDTLGGAQMEMPNKNNQ